MISYEKIKELCKRKGVTIAQCERDCGFSKGSLCKIEKSKPNSKRLKALSDYFNVSVDFIMNGENAEQYYYNAETQAMAEAIYKNPDLHMLFNATRGASADELRDFADMILLMRRREHGD